MTIEEAINALILENPLTADIEERLYEGCAEEDASEPYMCSHVQDEDPTFYLRSVSGNVRAQLRYEVWDKEPTRCRTIAYRVVDYLNEFKRGTCSEVEVKSLKAKIAGNDEEDDESGGDTRWYRWMIDVTADYVRVPDRE